MSLYGVMRTGVSGMSAQANRLSAVAENVANVSTTGYKRSSCEFSSLLLSNSAPDYESGAVLTDVRNSVSSQGSLGSSTSLTDLAISGNGFFIVADENGEPFLTRAGSFTPTGDGTLMNAAGFNLLGYRLDPDQPDVTVNGYTNLVPVNLDDLALAATPSTTGQITANLPAGAAIIAAADLPSTNSATSDYTAKSSLLTYDSLGSEVKLDMYFSKSGSGEWELAIYDSAAAANGGFPYSSGPLATQTLLFDSSGQLDAASADGITVAIPGGRDFTLNLADMTQLSADYVVLSAGANGNPPGGTDVLEIARDGMVYASYENGTRVPVYRIPLAYVTSPDMMMPLAGNVYSTTSQSGDVEIGFGQSSGLGDIVSGALEQSNVDLATELTSMIDAQRSYTANSKVFQTGSELMDVLMSLKR